MQALFVFTTLIGLGYFGFAKRRFDLFSLGFMSAVVYFCPGYWGYVLYNRAGDSLQVPIVSEAYAVMLCVLVALLLGAVFMDLFTQPFPIITRGKRDFLVPVSFAVACVSLLLWLVEGGQSILSANKLEVLAALNRWYHLFVTTASICAVIAFMQKRWFYCGACLLFMLFDVFVGFRNSIAVSLLAIFTYYFAQQGPQRIIPKNWHILVLTAPVALFIFAYKFVIPFVKMGAWSRVFRLLSDPYYYLSSITDSEPFYTQGILNRVIETHFKVGMSHLAALKNQLLVFAPELGAERTSFNMLFQPVLFPDLGTGLANSIWAELWSSGGWPLVIVGILLFVLVLALACRLLRSGSVNTLGAVLLMGAYWAFYIHRNDIGYQITLEKRLLLTFLGCVLLSILVQYITRRIKPPIRT